MIAPDTKIDPRDGTGILHPVKSRNQLTSVGSRGRSDRNGRVTGFGCLAWVGGTWLVAGRLLSYALAPVPLSPGVVPAPGPASVTVAGGAMVPLVTEDGRFLFFLSSAEGYVPSSSGVLEAYRLDLASGDVRWVSAPSEPGSSAGNVLGIVASPDGRWAAFVREGASVPGQPGGDPADVFWVDLTESVVAVERVTVGLAGGRARGRAELAGMSAGGQQVLFVSDAPELVAGDTNGVADVFLWDRPTRTLDWISVGFEGAAPKGVSGNPVMTPDARYVAFESRAMNVVASSLPGLRNSEIYLRDRQLRSTRLVSRRRPNENRFFEALTPAISPDGEWIAFAGLGVNLVIDAPETGSGWYHLWNRTTETLRQLPTLEPASRTATAQPAVFSPNSRWLAYADKGIVRSWDLTTGTSALLSTNLAGSPSGNASAVVLRVADDGSEVDFLSTQLDLVDLGSGPLPLARWYRHSARTGSVRLLSREPGNPQSESEVLAASASVDGSRIAFETGPVSGDPRDRNQDSDIRHGPPEGPLVFLRPARVPATARGRVRLPRESGPPGSTSRPVASGLFSPNGGHVLLWVEGGSVGASSNTWQLVAQDLAGSAWNLVSRGPLQRPSQGWPFMDAHFVSDGSAVIHSGRATDLVANDLNGRSDVFEFDLASGTHRLLSVAPGGIQALGGHSFRARSAPGGKSVVFATFATNLHAGAVGPGLRLLRVDRTTGDLSLLLFQAGNTNQSLSVPVFRPDGTGGQDVFVEMGPDAAGTTAHGVWQVGLTSGRAVRLDAEVRGPTERVTALRAGSPSVSDSGDRVAFEIQHGVQAGRVTSVAVWNRGGSEPAQLVSLDRAGAVIPADATAPRLAPDGAWVVFQTAWPGVNALVKGDSRTDLNEGADLYLRHLATGSTELISVNAVGSGTGNGASYDASVSPDGRWVAFTSRAGDLAFPETDRRPRIHLRDLRERRTWRLETWLGAGVGAVWSDDGRSLLFEGQGPDGSTTVQWLRVRGGDGDGDGLDDDWEVTHFGDLRRDGTGDFDRDAASDRDEFRAGTDPTNEGSVLRVMILRELGGRGVTVFWPSVAGRQYHLETKDDLDAPWTRLPEAVTATGAESRWTLPSAAGTGYLRITMP